MRGKNFHLTNAFIFFESPFLIVSIQVARGSRRFARLLTITLECDVFFQKICVCAGYAHGTLQMRAAMLCPVLALFAAIRLTTVSARQDAARFLAVSGCSADLSAIRVLTGPQYASEVLNFGELELINSSGVNIARTATASFYGTEPTQSACGQTMDAAWRAIDGDTCTYVSAIRPPGGQAWWLARFPAVQLSQLNRINFYIRDDSQYGRMWAFRTNGAIITLFDGDGVPFVNVTLPSNLDTLAKPYTISLSSYICPSATATSSPASCAVTNGRR